MCPRNRVYVIEEEDARDMMGLKIMASLAAMMPWLLQRRVTGLLRRLLERLTLNVCVAQTHDDVHGTSRTTRVCSSLKCRPVVCSSVVLFNTSIFRFASLCLSVSLQLSAVL